MLTEFLGRVRNLLERRPGAAEGKCCLTFDHIDSMGLKSGEYGGR
jgi:hypothetical protein